MAHGVSMPVVTAVLQEVQEVEEVRRVEGDLYSKINIIDLDESNLLMTDSSGEVRKVERRYVGGNSTCLTILRLQAAAELLRAG